MTGVGKLSVVIQENFDTIYIKTVEVKLLTVYFPKTLFPL